MIWTPIFSVGNEVLDQQHQGLFAIIAELQGHLASTSTEEGVRECLDRLRRYTRHHFRAEEALMTKASYAGLTTHCAQHADLCRRLDDFAARLARADPNVRDDLYFFLLSDWLAAHILQADQAYKNSLAALGLADVAN